MEAGFASHCVAPVDAHSVIAAAAASGSSPWASTSPRNDYDGGSFRRQLADIAQIVAGRQPSSRQDGIRCLQNLRVDKETDAHTQQLVERVRRGAAELACGNGSEGSNNETILPTDAKMALVTLLTQHGMKSAAETLKLHWHSWPGGSLGTGSAPGPGGVPVMGLGSEGDPIPTLQFSTQRARRSGGWL